MNIQLRLGQANRELHVIEATDKEWTAFTQGAALYREVGDELRYYDADNDYVLVDARDTR